MRKKVTDTTFTGFPAETLQYLDNLGVINTREWFHDNKESYEKYWLTPAYAFTNAMGKALDSVVKGITYEAKVNRSIFRINRDTRFSKDKAPYKNHLGIVFWKGPHADRHMNPGFYFHLEPHKLFLACGTWMPSPEALAQYRSDLQDKTLGSQFQKIVESLNKEGIFLNNEHSLKKIPKGFPTDHPMAEYSKYKTVYVEMQEVGGLPDIIHTPELIDYCMAFYSRPVKLLKWLTDMTERAYKG